MLYKYFTEKLQGLQDVDIEKVEEIDNSIHINCRLKRKPHKCPCCGNLTDKVHDYREQPIKDIPAFGKHIFIHLYKRRYRCSCGKRFRNRILHMFSHQMQNKRQLDLLSLVHFNPSFSGLPQLLTQNQKKKGFSRIYPHLLRHTFATNFVYNGGNLEVLRVLMGHSTINITQIYIHLAAQMHLVNDNYNSNLDKLLDNKKTEQL